MSSRSAAQRGRRNVPGYEADDPGHEAAWAEIIDRRLQDIATGRVELIDAVDAMAQARAAARR